MYKELIKNWIPNLTPDMIKTYGQKLGIFLTDQETMLLYQFAMKNYREILDGDESSFQKLKEKLNPKLYNQLLNLYQLNKEKYLK